VNPSFRFQVGIDDWSKLDTPQFADGPACDAPGVTHVRVAEPRCLPALQRSFHPDLAKPQLTNVHRNRQPDYHRAMNTVDKISISHPGLLLRT
jgi:hypothetical protein